ncbi:hypothetical protein FJQ54_15875 [Sandaracinobacter neustonicus]|uniref:Tyr recombinase domain-containing protein n=1 Tax=Sandaracinobacter neustonicus TaxID=1715348 RepID=A0A501XDE8_9SPHN|nr:tyrosine-type recombinase/integrase [Sandaracinobacter neustonicus]TPE58542.1 hypothetical protein FJQ54_15875 [Sandaracinobacter neustonicus]
MKQVRLPRYVSFFRDGGGIARYRFRCAKKGIDTYMKAQLFSPEWETEYHALMAGTVTPTTIGAHRYLPGTIGDMVGRYRASDEWSRKGPATRKAWNTSLGRLTEAIGGHPVSSLDADGARRILAKMADRPFAADNFRKRMKTLWSWSIPNLAKTNPWRETKPYARKTDGHRAWTEEEIVSFNRCFPLGSKEHLAMHLMLGTFARRSDAIRLGPQHVKRDRLQFRARKNGEDLDIPIMRDLRAALNKHKADSLCFLVTEFGRPFSDAGFGNWFGDRCRTAGVPGRAHGLRKLAAIRMALAGATVPELMAWGGWKTEREPIRYIQQANKAKLADAGAAKLSRHRAKLDKSSAKALKEDKK